VSGINLKKAKVIAEKIARQVGEFLLEKQNEVEILEFKDRQDILTNIDLQAERMILSVLEKAFPQHNILSEEKGVINRKSSFTWIIDPLDCTKEYIRGIPLYNTSIALEKDNEPILGIVYRPCGDDLFSGAKGLGVFQNKRPILLSSQVKLTNSFVYAYLPNYKTDPKMFSWAWKKLSLIGRHCYRIRGIVDENSAMCWVANGACEAFINFGNPTTKRWDVAAGMAILKEAGGRFTNLKGRRIENRDLNQGLVVSNGKIHEQLIKILS
jgi:myo-inositol-1(or 4)-monophosphatase